MVWYLLVASGLDILIRVLYFDKKKDQGRCWHGLFERYTDNII